MASVSELLERNGQTRGRTGALRCVLAHFAHQLWDGGPVALAAGLIQLLDIMRRLGLESREENMVSKQAPRPLRIVGSVPSWCMLRRLMN